MPSDSQARDSSPFDSIWLPVSQQQFGILMVMMGRGVRIFTPWTETLPFTLTLKRHILNKPHLAALIYYNFNRVRSFGSTSLLIFFVTFTPQTLKIERLDLFPGPRGSAQKFQA